MLNKREFVTGTVAAALAAGAAAAQTTAKISYGPQKPNIQHGMVKTTKLFKAPPGFVNALAVAPEGLWLGQQKLSGKAAASYHLPEPTDLREAAWLVDWNGKLLKTVMTNSRNTSGMAFGDGCVWMMANQDPEGVFQVDMNSKEISHRQIPLALPGQDGGGSHGAQWHNGKLWIVANRIKGILRVDPNTWTPEFMIPITTARWHGIAWDDSHPGGAIWMVTGSSDINRYVMQNGKLHHTTTCGLMKYDARTGELLETAEFLEGTADPHGLAMHNGKLISCDAGVGPPGFEGTGSPNAGYIFEINFV